MWSPATQTFTCGPQPQGYTQNDVYDLTKWNDHRIVFRAPSICCTVLCAAALYSIHMDAADIGSCAPEKPNIVNYSQCHASSLQKTCFVEKDMAESRWGSWSLKKKKNPCPPLYGIGLEFPQMMFCTSDGTFCKQMIAKTTLHHLHLIFLISSRVNKNDFGKQIQLCF